MIFQLIPLYRHELCCVLVRSSLFSRIACVYTQQQMRIPAIIVGALLACTRVQAGVVEPVPVDVSGASTQVLNPTDKLLFTVLSSNYSKQAEHWGFSSYPSSISFQFLTAPGPRSGEFTAWWQSAEGELWAPFPGTLSWSAGWFQSSAYTGPVSVLRGSMALSSATAAELVGSSAVLVLENEGAPVEVGLLPYALGGDLLVNFSTSGFGAGGVVTRVQYLDPPFVAPEPGSGLIFVVFGIVLCCSSWAMNRILRRHIQ